MLARPVVGGMATLAAVERGPRAHLTVEDADTPIAAAAYIVQEGLRMVRPYHFDFKCFVKQRWAGKSVIDIFSSEFPARDRSYYIAAFEDGRLRVEGQQVSRDTPLKNGMCIRHFIHRHEPPALATPVTVLAVQDDIVAVHKPACLPVHTAGQYRKNTVLGVLQAMHPELWPLYPTHRLDKPVSGLLLLAKSGAAANLIRAALEDGQLQKVYVARVEGVLPVGKVVVVDAPLCWDHKTNHASVPSSGGEGEAGGAKAAKEAVTEFKGLEVAADGRTSLVECRPRTGRTHQIRVHLQHLGHPIANDTQYGGSYGGPLAPRILKRPAPTPRLPVEASEGSTAKKPRLSDEGAAPAGASCRCEAAGVEQGGAADTAMEASAASASTRGQHSLAADRPADDDGGRGSSGCSSSTSEAAATAGAPGSATGRQPKFRVAAEELDPLCTHCPSLPPVNYPIDLQPLWLHAEAYSGPQWSFRCPRPEWAAPGWELQAHLELLKRQHFGLQAQMFL